MVAYILLFIIFIILALLIYSESKNTEIPPKKEPRPKADKKAEKLEREAKERAKRETEAKAKEELRKATELQKKRAKKAAEATAKREEEERKAKEEAEKLKAEKIAAREAAEAKAKKEAEEAAAKKAEEERRSAEAERKAKEEAERKEAQRKAEEARRAQEEAEKARAEKVAEEKAAETAVAVPEYPAFDHARLVEMGLSEDEAKDFAKDLIAQIEEQLPLIEKALQDADFEQVERLTHSIKGSATNIGTGGVADLLNEYNTYLKAENDPAQAKAYYEALKIQLEKLKVKYL